MRTAKAFLQALHDDLKDGEYIELRGFRDGQKNIRLFTHDIPEALRWIEEHRETYNLYVGINPRASNTRGTNEDIKHAHWIWVDIDAKKLNDIPAADILKRVLSRVVLPPHIIVYTGGGVHLYYRLVDTTDLDAVQRLCNAISEMTSGDPLGDPARIFRIPGTYNFKYDPPRPVTLEHCIVDFEYTPEDLGAATLVSPKAAKRIDIGDSRGFDSRSERDWSVVRELLVDGMTDDAIRYVFSKRTIGDKAAEVGDKYLEHTIERAHESLAVSESDTPDDSVESPLPTVPNAVPKKHKKRRTLRDQWTVVDSNDCMFASSADGELRQLSTFVLVPKVLLQGDIEDGTEDALLCDVRASGYTWCNIPFTRSAFNRTDTLTKQLPAMAWQWLGSDKDIRKLLPWLMDELRRQGLPKRKGTPILGVHDNEYVGPSQTMTRDGILDPDEAKMVWLPTRRVHPKVQLTWALDDEVEAMLRAFMSLYLSINEPGVIYPVLGWYTATTLKTRLLEESRARMPILNLFGTRGSGKTSLITAVMQPLFCYADPVAWDFNSTKFVMLSLLGSTNATPISFAEYRRSSAQNDQLERYIRLTYDLGEDSRGKPDQTTQSYPLVAPFTIDGEDSIADPACMERVVQVSLHPETIAEGSRAYSSFLELRELPLGIIGTRLIAWLLDYDPRFEAALELMHQVFPIALPDRVRRNLAVVTVGLQAFSGFCELFDVEFPLLTPEFLHIALSPALDNVVNQVTGRTALLVDEFIEDVVSAVAMSIDQRPPGFIFKYSSQDNVLYVNLTTSMRWWFRKRVSEHLQVLDSAAMKQQLRERMPRNGGVTEPGFYIMPATTRTVDGRPSHVYPIDISMAAETGLDVPERLTQGVY